MRRGSASAPQTVSLCGMMGSGKSTVARHLARLAGLPLLSTDALVEARAGRTIARLFAEEGEPAFRALERAAVGGLVPPAVVDLGGGAFCHAPSAERLLALGPVVFLDVSPAEAARRLGAGEGRPLAASWPALRARRLPLYRRATHCVAVDGQAPEALARRILALLGWEPRAGSDFAEPGAAAEEAR